jgi:hypothetical protein
LQVVADHSLAIVVQAELGEPCPDVRAVGVEDLPEEQLGPDGEDFDVHSRSPPM